MTKAGSRTRYLLMTACAAFAMTSATVYAQDGDRTRYNITSQDLGTALTQLARQSNREIYFSADLTRGLRSPRLQGRLTLEQALDRLLRGTGLRYRLNSAGAIVISRNSEPAAASEPIAVEPDFQEASVTVTGTRIRGAPPTSPVIEITAEEMRNAGQTDLGEVARSIPQNFPGGENPGIGRGLNASGSENVGSAFSLNLRGLGPGATLTLLNGRRLPYTSIHHGTDLSAIPIAAVERIEIIADGASALYGSDVVGGVANVILRRDYDGASITARIGGSTDGGNTRYQISGTAGQSWSSGNIILSGNFSRSSPIVAGQRSYTSTLHPTATLYPYLRSYGGLASGRQDLIPGVTLSVDALYNWRVSETNQATTLTGDFRFRGQIHRPVVETFLVSPQLDFSMPGRWRGAVNASFGRETFNGGITGFTGGVVTTRQVLNTINELRGFEINAEGPLIALPGGDIRIALGSGYREARFRRSNQVNTAAATTFGGNRDSFYGFGEIYVPLVSPDQGIAGVNRLSLSAAMRYEDYSEFGSVATPKVGFTYSPSTAFTFSGSWGRSFRAPTLNEQFGTNLTSLVPVSLVGGTGFPAGSTALFQASSNPTLGPERSTNWTVSFAAHPPAVEGLRIELSYFNVDYTDRIVTPITNIALALASPDFAQFVTLTPTRAQIDQVVASADTFNNLSGQPFNPANVVAIVDGRFANAARQKAEGVDFAITYGADIGSRSSLTGTLGASYLRMERQLLEGQSFIPIAGVVFNPPHLRGRAGLTFNREPLTLSSHANYTGSLEDRRTATTSTIGSQVTFDLAGIYRFDISSFLRGFDLQIAAINIFNAKPPRVTFANATIPAFDSANYTALGRTITFSLTTRFR